jgi:ribonucleotide reductase beta subunit family protein with ferritin-like domain
VDTSFIRQQPSIGFDSMFEDDMAAPPPWVPPPPTNARAARVSHEFFDQPATSYGMENTLMSLF